MKLLLTLLLCGIICCTALPTCTDEIVKKCDVGPDDASLPEEENLNRRCKKLRCLMDTCKYEIPVGNYDLNKQIHRSFVAICLKHSSPLRQAYLNSAKCLRDLKKSEGSGCPKPDSSEEHYCRRVRVAYACESDFVEKKCGQDGKDIYQLYADPYYIDCTN